MKSKYKYVQSHGMFSRMNAPCKENNSVVWPFTHTDKIHTEEQGKRGEGWAGPPKGHWAGHEPQCTGTLGWGSMHPRHLTLSSGYPGEPECHHPQHPLLPRESWRRQWWYPACRQWREGHSGPPSSVGRAHPAPGRLWHHCRRDREGGFFFFTR